jgi:lysophospholipid acyltransferase (LPLAT)-like uncharacterized protein
VYRIAVAVVPPLNVGLSRLLFATCRVRMQGRGNLDRAVEQGTIIAAFWHYSMLYIFHNLRHLRAAVMVSASKDGEYIARVARLYGHVPVRGSSNRKGVSGLKKMLREVRSGNNAGIVADGSQGPARQAQPGAILVASRTGSLIVPMAWGASRYIAFNSWDRTVVPLPFSTLHVCYEEPLSVPRGIDAQGIEEYRLELENRLNTAYEKAWQGVNRKPHDEEARKK